MQSLHEKHGPDSAVKQVRTLVQFALRYVPNSEQVKFSLFGTGRVAQMKPGARKDLLQRIRALFESEYKFQVVKIDILPGQDEALFSWIGVHYLDKLLNRMNTPKAVVELGGASAQITIPVSEEQFRKGLEEYPSDYWML